MKKNCFVLSLLSVLFSSVSLAAGEIDLSTVSVVADQAYAEEREELVSHIALIAGKAPDGSGPVRFVLGVPPDGEKTAPFTAYGCRKGNTIHLWGDDRRTKRYSTTRRGTLHAVAGFLETVLGVRWVFPGKDGIVFTPAKHANVPDGWRWEYYPPLGATEIRSGSPAKEMKENNPYLPSAMRDTEDMFRTYIGDRNSWMHRMRHQIRTRPTFGHAFTKWTDRFMKTHPEYFAMQEDGSRCRKRSRRNELCVSNEDVVDQIIADWKADKCPKYFNVCPNDTTKYCRCPECRKLDRPLASDEPFGLHVTDRYVNFWNRIARKALAVRPDVMICTYAYASYREAPRVEKLEFPDNFVIGMVPSQEDDNAAQIAAWKKAGLKHLFLRPNYLCYRGVIPRGYERFFYDNFQLNLREGMIGCDYDAYARGGVTDFETYVLGRVAANPELSFDRLEEEFLSQFGPAKETMRRYFHRVRERGEKALAEVRARPPNTRERRLDDSQLWKTVVATHPVSVLNEDAAIVDEAYSTPGLSDVEKRRILKYKCIVRNAIATQRFIAARDQVPRKEFFSIACDLIELRTQLKRDLPDTWGRVFRSFPLEVKWWRYVAPELKKKYPEMELED